MDEDDLIDHRRGTVESVFEEFTGRRAGLLKALTVDADNLFKECDPRDESLCLFGNPNGTWSVRMPSVIELLPGMPDPTPGINFVRDEMTKTRWLSFVANYCDTWLLCVAFHDGALCGFTRNDRESLFRMINTVQPLREIVGCKRLRLAPELRGFWTPSWTLQNARKKMAIQINEKAEASRSAPAPECEDGRTENGDS